MTPSKKNINWSTIKPNNYSTDFFSDLLILGKNLFLVKVLLHRDFVAIFKQTIIGPAWFVIQPLFTTIVFTIIFDRVAEISTDGLPPFLFYLSGILLWGYFTSNVGRVSALLFENSHLLNKTYFPIMIIPLTNILINLFKSSIQIALFVFFLFYFKFIGIEFKTSFFSILILLFVFLVITFLSVGIGLFFCSMTTKYKDLNYVNSFIIGMLMYLTPVVYPLSSASGKLEIFLLLNPITSITELLRLFFLGEGTVNLYWLFYSVIVSLIIFYIGYFLFKRISITFIDTI